MLTEKQITRKQKQLKAHNKAIADGRLKSSLTFALAIAVGLAIGNLITGKGIFSVLMMAAISFLLIFIFRYVSWAKSAKKAQTICDELGAGEVASPKRNTPLLWLVVIIFPAILLLPTIFNKQLATVLVQYQQDARAEMVLTREGTEYTLTIPQLYIIPRKNDTTLNIFGETSINRVSFTALLDTLEPLPIATKNYSSSERSEQTVKKNANIFHLRTFGVEANSDGFAVLKKTVMEKINLNKKTAEHSEKAGFTIQTGTMMVPLKEGKRIYHKKQHLSVGYNAENNILMCDTVAAECHIITNIELLGTVILSFNKTHLPTWQTTIREKANTLIKSFVTSEKPITTEK